MQPGKQPYTLPTFTSGYARSGRSRTSCAKNRFSPRLFVKSGNVYVITGSLRFSPQLRERIDKQIVVTKDNDGSSRAQIIV